MQQILHAIKTSKILKPSKILLSKTSNMAIFGVKTMALLSKNLEYLSLHKGSIKWFHGFQSWSYQLALLLFENSINQ